MTNAFALRGGVRAMRRWTPRPSATSINRSRGGRTSLAIHRERTRLSRYRRDGQGEAIEDFDRQRHCVNSSAANASSCRGQSLPPERRISIARSRFGRAARWCSSLAKCRDYVERGALYRSRSTRPAPIADFDTALRSRGQQGGAEDCGGSGDRRQAEGRRAPERDRQTHKQGRPASKTAAPLTGAGQKSCSGAATAPGSPGAPAQT